MHNTGTGVGISYIFVYTDELLIYVGFAQGPEAEEPYLPADGELRPLRQGHIHLGTAQDPQVLDAQQKRTNILIVFFTSFHLFLKSIPPFFTTCSLPFFLMNSARVKFDLSLNCWR
jgi:hypothetical protein